jgi:hypothetical protein
VELVLDQEGVAIEEMTKLHAMIDFLAGRDTAKGTAEVAGDFAIDFKARPTALRAGRLYGKAAKLTFTCQGASGELRLDQAGRGQNREAGQQGTAGKPNVGLGKEQVAHDGRLPSTRYIE